jgi:hypothetical protein
MVKYLLILTVFVGCVKPGYICLYEIETTNIYPPAKSFKSYKIDNQYRYCNQHHNNRTTGSNQSTSNRLRKEMENTPDNIDKMQEVFNTLTKEEVSRDCTVAKK